jgi:hypothetical protein
MRFFCWQLHSAGKMNLFYGVGAVALVVLMMSLVMADLGPRKGELASEGAGRATVGTASGSMAWGRGTDSSKGEEGPPTR